MSEHDDDSGGATPINSAPSSPKPRGANHNISQDNFSPHGIISGVIHDFSHLSETKQLLQSPSKYIRQRKRKENGGSISMGDLSGAPGSQDTFESDAWQYPGWGSVSYEDVDLALAPKEPNKKILGLWPSTAIAGNDLLASVLYTIGVTSVQAGPLSVISLLLVVVFLWPYRWIYSEVGSALPLNGGSYNCLLNATTKSFATIAACLSLISYTATAVVSAASATAYLGGEFGGFNPFWPTLGILAVFALLVFLGMRDSAIVATVIFTTHTIVLTVLIFASIVSAAKTGGDLFVENFKHYNYGNPVKDVFFGFSVGLLGITGFETASNYIEEVKDGVFPKTMNLMWVLVAIYNPIIALLSTGVVRVEEIQASPANGLSIIAGAAAGQWLRYLIAVDAAVVLCGGVLTAYVGVGGLIKRLAEDNCLPKLLLHKNPLTHTYHISVLAFFILTGSLYAIVDGDITSLSGVFAVAFLSVMCMFAVGNLILKFKRPMLPRQTVTPWYWVIFGLSGMLAGLIGNLIQDPSILIYFTIYFVVTMSVVALTLGRIMVMKLILMTVQNVPFLRRFNRHVIGRLFKMRQTSVIFFTKTDKIHVLNKAVLYAHHNEMCDHIKLIHIYKHESEIPSQLKENHYIIDHMYPKIKIDLVLIEGTFTPDIVRILSARFGVPLSFMFTQCPARDFPYNIGEFGGVRTIMK